MPETGAIPRAHRHRVLSVEKEGENGHPGPISLGTGHQLGMKGTESADDALQRRLRGVQRGAQGQGDLLLDPDGWIDDIRRSHGPTGHQSEAPIGVEVRQSTLPIGATRDAGNPESRSELGLDHGRRIGTGGVPVNKPIVSNHGIWLAVPRVNGPGIAGTDVGEDAISPRIPFGLAECTVQALACAGPHQGDEQEVL